MKSIRNAKLSCHGLVTTSIVHLLDKKNPDFKTLKQIHARIISDPKSCSDTSLAIKLMRAYAACGKPDVTRNIFDRIPVRNNVICNVMIMSYVNNHLYDDALEVWKEMELLGVKPDFGTMASLFPAVINTSAMYANNCMSTEAVGSTSSFKTLKQIHARIISDPKLCSDTSLAIKLMRAYAACGKPDVTRNIFDRIPVRNNVICNVMIMSYVNNHLYDDALEVWKEMELLGVKPDFGTMASLCPAVTNTSAMYANNCMSTEAVGSASSLSQDRHINRQLHHDVFGNHPGTGLLFVAFIWKFSKLHFWGLWSKKCENLEQYKSLKESDGLDNVEEIILTSTSYLAKDFHKTCDLTEEQLLKYFSDFNSPDSVAACNKRLHSQWKKHGIKMKLEPKAYAYICVLLGGALAKCLSAIDYKSGNRIDRSIVQEAFNGCLKKLSILDCDIGASRRVRIVSNPSKEEDSNDFYYSKFALQKQLVDGHLELILCDAPPAEGPASLNDQSEFLYFP